MTIDLIAGDTQTEMAMRAIQSLVAAGWVIRGFSEAWPTRTTNSMKIEWRKP